MLPLLLALCLTGTPTMSAKAAPQPPAPPVELSAFIRRPDRVRIYRADVAIQLELQKRSKKEPRIRVGPFVLLGKGDVVPAEAAQTLAMTWVPPGQVDHSNRKRCIFNPDIGLRFEKDGSFVDVVVCFGCGELAFYDARGEGLHDGRFDFRVLRRIAADAFPKEFGEKASE
jgi:hypothetical protein